MTCRYIAMRNDDEIAPTALLIKYDLQYGSDIS